MFNDYSLYFVTSEECSLGRKTLKVAREAIFGGVDIIQMREKNMPKDILLSLGIELAGLCKNNSITFLVNDDPYIAKETSSDGVHLGQDDILKYPIRKTREIVGKDKIIGVSTHSLEQFLSANNSDVDYIAYGPVFQTKTKDYFIGAEEIEKIMNVSLKPVVFIGGINTKNIDDVLDRGGRNIAVIRAISESEDIKKTTQDLKEKILNKK